MKRIFTVGFFALFAGFAFAGGVENKTNMSTGYLRNPSRNAEAERPEAAFYNIAGTSFLNDGLYFELGNQFIVKEYKNTLATDALSALGIKKGESYNDETFVYLYPDADIVYKHGPFAVFGNFGIYAGGGTLDYSEGTAVTTLLFGSKAATALTAAATYGAAGDNTTAERYKTIGNGLLAIAKDHSLNVKSITYGEQIGASYNFMDMISVAAGVRFLEGTLSMGIESDGLKALQSGTDEISCEASAFGVSPVFGLHVRPIKTLDIALQYQMATKMNYEISDVKGSLAGELGIKDGNEYRNDLAHVINFGLGYRVIEPLYVSASFNYYINSAVEFGSVLGENEYDNSFEFALGADYRFNELISASLGLAYGKQGTDDENNSAFNPILDSFQFGGGVEINPIENLSLILGAQYVKYFDSSYMDDMVDLSKNLFMFSLGASYRLPI